MDAFRRERELENARQAAPEVESAARPIVELFRYTMDQGSVSPVSFVPRLEGSRGFDLGEKLGDGRPQVGQQGIRWEVIVHRQTRSIHRCDHHDLARVREDKPYG